MKKLYVILTILFTAYGVFAQTEQIVLVEHFSNSRCSVCASKNPAFYNLLGNYPQVLHLAIHPSAPYSNCIFYQHNPAENDARTNFYGVYGSTPRVVVQGTVITPSSQLLTSSQLEDFLGMNSDYSFSFKHTIDNNDIVHVEITVKRISGLGQGGLKLFAVLAEKQVDYNAPNGEDIHHDVFRKVIVDESINLASVGDSVIHNVTYTIDADWDQDEMYVIGMVQKESDKSILQSGKSGFAVESTGIFNQQLESPENVFYPNPVSEDLYFKPEYQNQFSQVEIFNLFGEKVKSADNADHIYMGDLSKGDYFLVLTGQDNTRYTTKFVKN